MNILIADDHVLIRNALAFFINTQEDMQVIGDAADGHEVYMAVERCPVDVVLMDVSMPPGENGFLTTKRIKEAYPHVKVIILTMHDGESFIREALIAKADGFLLKSAHEEILLHAIHQVYQGHRYFYGYTETDLAQIKLSKEDTLYETLSKREKEILPLIALGYNNKEIAERLFISVKTVEVHKANIRKKLQLESYAGLLHYALKHHLIDF